MFHTKIRYLIPNRRGGVDGTLAGIGEDGMNWAIKHKPGRPLAITEYLGYRIYEACGFAMPYCGTVTLPDGSEAFGSRIEGGLDAPVTGKGPKALLDAIQGEGDMLSGVLAVDVWFANNDRHWGNFLWRHNDLGALALMPIDFSRAFMMTGWPPPDIRHVTCNTTTLIKVLRQMKLWHPAAAAVTLTGVGSIDRRDVEQWLHAAPDAWLAEPQREQLLAWWGGQNFQQRLQNCVEYCA